MNLQEHLDILGWDTRRLAFKAKIEEPVIARALTGLPITKSHAEKICHVIGMEFGHNQHHEQAEYHIDAIATVGK